MNYAKTGVDLHLEPLINQNSADLSNQLMERIIYQQDCNDEFVKQLVLCEEKKLPKTKVIINIAAFINLISIDLKTISRDLILSKDEWCKRHYIRQSHLLIYEFNNTYNLLQKDFIAHITSTLNINHLEHERLENASLLREYNKKYKNLFYSIRNNTIAHREADIVSQVRLIEGLIFSDSVEAITKFDVILNKMGSYFGEVIKEELKRIGVICN